MKRQPIQRQRLAMLVVGLPVLICLAAVTVLASSSNRSYLPLGMRGPVSTEPVVARINFQPSGAQTPPGYLPDGGAPFADRGNGFAYGWNADNRAATRERNAASAIDQRYDTLIHLQQPENPDAVWEIALPNGLYEVYLVAGDPAFFDGNFRIAVENVLVVDGAPTEARRFVEGFDTVAVGDGRLTVRSAPGAVNNKLAFLEIYRPPQPTPTVTPTASPPPQNVEFRGLWVTRFDWTRFNQPADPAKIDEIVNNAARAGFNAIFFQVRGAADAYYAPGLEPWAQRVSGGALGQAPNPAWDPLAYFAEKAHARGIQLHAYLNVHPVWDNCAEPPPQTSPAHLYHRLRNAHGLTGDKLNGLQWTTAGQVHCSVYWRYSPASQFANDHFVAVAADLVNRYNIDGLHLDNVRYGGGTLSCDPVSEAAYGAPCFTFNGRIAYEEWQRRQINDLVRRVYEQVVVPARRDLWLSAAVWPVYRDYWGWGVNGGYNYYYQDSQGWMRGGYIDGISPMIYPGTYNCPDNSFWTQARWRTLVTEFQAQSNGRHLVPGIGTGYCSFDEIEARIEAARSIGTAGHALFSYGALLTNDYFDDLAAGPYARPAAPPAITWHD